MCPERLTPRGRASSARSYYKYCDIVLHHNSNGGLAVLQTNLAVLEAYSNISENQQSLMGIIACIAFMQALVLSNIVVSAF